MHFRDYAPEPQWMPTAFIKVARPKSSAIHIQTLFGPRRGGDGIPTTLCGRVKSYVEVRPTHSYVACSSCAVERARIEDREAPRYVPEDRYYRMTADAQEACDRAWRDYMGRIRQANHERDIYVTGQLDGSLAAKALSDQCYAHARDEAWREHRAQLVLAERPTPVPLALQAAHQVAVDRVVAEARDLGAEVTQVQDETIIRYSEAPEPMLLQVDRLRAEWQSQRLEDESISAWFLRTRALRRRYIPDPDPSEVPEWGSDTLRLELDTPPRAEALDLLEAREYELTEEGTEGYVTTDRYLSHDATPIDHTEAQKAGATARGRKAYAADFLGQPLIPGRTRVEHEADRGNLGRVTRSEDPAVWVRWDDDPGHDYRYVAGELRIV